MRNAVNYLYIVILGIAIYNAAWMFALYVVTVIVFDFVDHQKEKANKEYTDLLQKHADYWRNKYIEEKASKTSYVECSISEN